MISELFLYGDAGLFKSITAQSKVLAGRYFVAPNYGAELNTANLNQFIKDPASGLADVAQKYPCCVCMPPRNTVKRVNGIIQELYVFNLFFLTLNGRTGTGQVKNLDTSTNTSNYPVWKDWADMNAEAILFIDTLKKLERLTISGGGILAAIMQVDYDGGVITRISKCGNDNVNGVSVSFQVSLMQDTCSNINVSETDIPDIAL